MKKLLVFGSIVILFASCKKETESKCPYVESSLVAPAGEIATLQAYVTTSRPAAIQHPSGLFYEILAPGAGTTFPGICNTVSVKYAGYLTNGTKFDENLTGISFSLGQLIVGWQKGIPLVKKGGSINLYIPPSLGYGSNAVGSIPANSILVFNIQLIDFQ